jgi:Cytochrome c554 and c-prime
MRRAGWLTLITLALLLAGGLALLWRPHRVPPVQPREITGLVRGAAGPVGGARVRVKGTAEFVLTEADGHFRFPALADRARLTASKEGHLIAGQTADSRPLVLDLQPLPGADSEAYAWVDPTSHSGQGHNCGNCHTAIYQEWLSSGHARAAVSRHFRGLYDGSDWTGQPAAGWNLLAERPDGAGVCTACHAPTVGFDDPAYYDLRQVRGVAAMGAHCDYCHKVQDVTGRVGLTHGRFGLRLLRPAGEEQLFFGPLDDVDRGEDVYAPLYRESRYCASCHEGKVFGVPVYSTYSEWLASPARQEGKQCQDCHMRPTGQFTNIAPGHGGIERNPRTLGNHLFFAGSQEEMLRGALHVGSTIAPAEDGIGVTVEVRADNVGHCLPTGFVDRHLLLVVEGFTADGVPLPARSGAVLPAAAGKELARQPGRLFAKVLKDFDGRSPVPFWNADPDAADTRLRPGKPQREEFVFPRQTARVRVRLVYRRFWQEVAESKGWPDNEIAISEQQFGVGGP